MPQGVDVEPRRTLRTDSLSRNWMIAEYAIQYYLNMDLIERIVHENTETNFFFEA